MPRIKPLIVGRAVRSGSRRMKYVQTAGKRELDDFDGQVNRLLRGRRVAPGEDEVAPRDECRKWNSEDEADPAQFASAGCFRRHSSTAETTLIRHRSHSILYAASKSEKAVYPSTLLRYVQV